MVTYLSNLPSIEEFFPPTPPAWHLIQAVFKTIPLFSLLQWTTLSKLQAMGRTSSTSTSILNLPGRLAWSVAESVGPINLIYVLYTLPRHLHPLPLSTTTTTLMPNTGLFGTGLPLTHELLGLLYVLHYVNRAIISPWSAPSMSPIHFFVASLMALFQYLNSSSLAGWLCYNAQARASLSALAANADRTSTPLLISGLSILGTTLFMAGLIGNISAERHLFSLRRGAAKRKAKSEGKATITYDKVYVIPDAKGLFKSVMYPHYSLEWLEWTGYWVLGGAWGLGWSWKKSAALMFLVNEIVTMTPRAIQGIGWYEGRFGRRAVAGRKAVVPGVL